MLFTKHLRRNSVALIAGPVLLMSSLAIATDAEATQTQRKTVARKRSVVAKPVNTRRQRTPNKLRVRTTPVAAPASAVAGAAVAPTAQSSGTQSSGADLAQDIFNRVNNERALRGLSPLRWDDRLAGIAVEWAGELATSSFRHRPNVGDRYRQAGITWFGYAENIYVGQSTSAEIHDAWMRSSGHRSNVLNPGLDAIGIGIVCDSSGRAHAVENFASFVSPNNWDAGAKPDQPRATDASGGLRC